MKNFDIDVAITVEAVRGALKQSQNQLASGMGVSTSALNRKLGAKSGWTVDDLGRLACFWGCTPSDLLGGAAHAVQAVIGSESREAVVA